MSAEKTTAIVIRLANFSESSQVVTLFSRDFGKISCLAKGAKRLRNPFQSALDLLSRCHVVFLRKSSGALHLLTEAQLLQRFSPAAQNMTALYAGYYVAELLEALTEPDDPHPQLFDAAVFALDALGAPAEPAESLPDLRMTVMRFELAALRETGLLPDFETCQVCGQPLQEGSGRHWVSQGGVICADCGKPEFQHTEVQPGTLAILARLAQPEWSPLLRRLVLRTEQWLELRRVVTSAICQTLGKRPKMLAYLNFAT